MKGIEIDEINNIFKKSLCDEYFGCYNLEILL
jgi:hypothetical protein